MAAELEHEKDDDSQEFSPLEIDCPNSLGCTPLHLAVQNGCARTVEFLILNGADVNRPLLGVGGFSSDNLMEACQRGNVPIMDILLRHGMIDEEQMVLKASILSQNDSMISTILKHHAKPDPEFHINKQAMKAFFFEQSFMDDDNFDSNTATYNLVFPTVPVMVKWDNLSGLSRINPAWLVQASLMHNLRLTNRMCALYAITRVDISQNSLETLPIDIFRLESLQVLNASKNRISYLPCDRERRGSLQERKGCNVQGQLQNMEWSCPVLETIQLQNNILKSLPSSIFQLPSLARLNVSHNRLEHLPFAMWSAPSLLELNLSYNRLSFLPTHLEVPDSASADQVTSSDVPPAPPNSIENSFSSRFSSRSAEGENSIFPIVNNFTETLSSLSPRIFSRGGSTRSSTRSSNATVTSGDHFTLEEVEHYNIWSQRVKVKDTPSGELGQENVRGMLKDLYLSGNQFTTIPEGLACLAPSLNRLFLSQNLLKEMGTADAYPAGLQWLDLSNNLIFSRGQLRQSSESDIIAASASCYVQHGAAAKKG